MIYWRALNGSLERIFDIFFGQTRFPVKGHPEQEKPTIAAKAPEGRVKNA